MTIVCVVVMMMFACALYVGMLLLAPIAACDVVIPVFDFVKILVSCKVY